jgi:hypothetical protein
MIKRVEVARTHSLPREQGRQWVEVAQLTRTANG